MQHKKDMLRFQDWTGQVQVDGGHILPWCVTVNHLSANDKVRKYGLDFRLQFYI